jgi:hypothetical protein
LGAAASSATNSRSVPMTLGVLLGNAIAMLAGNDASEVLNTLPGLTALAGELVSGQASGETRST